MTAVNVIDADTRVAQVIVPDYQLSLAIGKEGQNARLAARLTGWRIDIRSDAQPQAAPSAAAPEAAPPEAAPPEASPPEGAPSPEAQPDGSHPRGAADAPAR